MLYTGYVMNVNIAGPGACRLDTGICHMLFWSREFVMLYWYEALPVYVVHLFMIWHACICMVC